MHLVFGDSSLPHWVASAWQGLCCVTLHLPPTVPPASVPRWCCSTWRCPSPRDTLWVCRPWRLRPAPPLCFHSCVKRVECFGLILVLSGVVRVSVPSVCSSAYCTVWVCLYSSMCFCLSAVAYVSVCLTAVMCVSVSAVVGPSVCSSVHFCLSAVWYMSTCSDVCFCMSACSSVLLSVCSAVLSVCFCISVSDWNTHTHTLLQSRQIWK